MVKLSMMSTPLPKKAINRRIRIHITSLRMKSLVGCSPRLKRKTKYNTRLCQKITITRIASDDLLCQSEIKAPPQRTTASRFQAPGRILASSKTSSQMSTASGFQAPCSTLASDKGIIRCDESAETMAPCAAIAQSISIMRFLAQLQMTVETNRTETETTRMMGSGSHNMLPQRCHMMIHYPI